MRVLSLVLVLLAYAIQGNAAQNITLSQVAPYEVVIWEGTRGTGDSSNQFIQRPISSGALISNNFVLTVTTRTSIPAGGLSVTVGRTDLWNNLNVTAFHDVIRIIKYNNSDPAIPDLALYEIKLSSTIDPKQIFPVEINPAKTLDGQACNMSVWRISNSLLYAGPTIILDNDNHCKNDDGFFCTLDVPKDEYYMWDGGLMVCNARLSGLYTAHISPIVEPKRRGYFDVAPYLPWIRAVAPGAISAATTLSTALGVATLWATVAFAAVV